MLQLCPQWRWYQADGCSPRLKALSIRRDWALSRHHQTSLKPASEFISSGHSKHFKYSYDDLTLQTFMKTYVLLAMVSTGQLLPKPQNPREGHPHFWPGLGQEYTRPHGSASEQGRCIRVLGSQGIKTKGEDIWEP